MKSYIVTVATHSDLYLPYLIDTCKKNNTNLHLLGYGEKWQGFNWRNKLMLTFLEDKKDDDIICFIDGFDVVCVNRIDEMFEKKVSSILSREECKIIVGHDKAFHPIIRIINNNKFGNCNNIPLNAGTYVGYAKQVREVISKILIINSNGDSDDQILLTNYCKSNSRDIYIDTKSEIFLTISNPLKEIDKFVSFSNDMVYFNDQNPYFIHAPSTYLNNILVKLNYDNSDELKQIENKISKKTTFIFHLLKYMNTIVILVLLIAVISLYKRR